MREFPNVTNRADDRMYSNLILRSRGVRLTWIPKVMCSTLKLSFALDAGVIPLNQERAFVDNYEWIHNWMFPLEPQHQLELDQPISAAVLRDPLARLRSAILQKGVYQQDLQGFEIMLGERLRHYAHYNHRPVEEHTFADVLAAIRFFPDRLWDVHYRSQIGFLCGRYTHLIPFEGPHVARFFDLIGVRLVTVDSHSIARVSGEDRVVSAEEKLFDLRAEMARNPRPIRFAADLQASLEQTVRERYAADLALWREISA